MVSFFGSIIELGNVLSPWSDLRIISLSMEGSRVCNMVTCISCVVILYNVTEVGIRVNGERKKEWMDGWMEGKKEDNILFLCYNIQETGSWPWGQVPKAGVDLRQLYSSTIYMKQEWGWGGEEPGSELVHHCYITTVSATRS